MNSLSNVLSITGARVEVRDDNNDALIGISQQVRTSPAFGSGTQARGAQNAVVLSLRTNTPGGSGRGRLYWPSIAGVIGTDLRLAPALALSIATDLKTYLLGMRSALAAAFPTIGFDLAVRSRTTHTTPHVNKVQMGTVLDTQRRRRDKVVEDYQTLSFP